MKNNEPICLEVALNGAAGRAFQPNIPLSVNDIVAEGIACAKAGASVIHLHVYDDDGQPVEDADLYRRVIEGIREQVDTIVYPTLALHGDMRARFEPIERLIDWGLLEWMVVDPGSVNILHRTQVLSDSDGILYANPVSHIRYGLELCAQHSIRPAYAIYEPGFVRLGVELANTLSSIPAPIYRLMFSDNLLFGTRPIDYALSFYASMLNDELGSESLWMISGLDAEITSLIEPSIQLGAHVRVGLEDAPFGSRQTNIELVESAVDLIEASGYSLATSSDVRTWP